MGKCTEILFKEQFYKKETALSKERFGKMFLSVSLDGECWFGGDQDAVVQEGSCFIHTDACFVSRFAYEGVVRHDVEALAYRLKLHLLALLKVAECGRELISW